MERKAQFSLSLIFLTLFVIWAGVRIYDNIVFNINCQDRLKRAADANTVGLAKQELKAVLDYLQHEGLTSGYTSVLYNSPSEDLGFWYSNLKKSYEELVSLPANVTPLERSNMLMKLRETLLDSGESSVNVTVPKGISVFPNNALFQFWAWITGVPCVVFSVWWLRKN
ncbi:hypothetical protein A2755_02920 [Candidatus Wolfebacteria bacterium RIFCSPHIGHO2_01_FULL_48_22]|uniref:Uncharacterized protein n=2 Tax=Candidatus Wolfeibacteriota TaxID=1752735 RepID=A0A1F8DTK1_9BACT|nr:MAG: hypothetical protein A2755_02920 [Candidatus Wolfebacteria bacterium RIFCSPHIGHO2_01_FULL_48_22]OGM92182.1 MAG: hypothetical protein A2935_00145 [Candidatus Wolfebacteria bacterium RIFCSPLOWO2_01_FULL_47_17b]